MYEDKAVQKLKMIQDALLDFGKSQYELLKRRQMDIVLFYLVNSVTTDGK